MIQGKGAVGKLFFARVLGQYGKEKCSAPTYYADLDLGLTNSTFYLYPALNAEHIAISSSANEINRRRFDDQIETLCLQVGFSLVSTEAPTFLPLMSYLSENKSFAPCKIRT